MKVVKNTCFGGFGISQEAYEKLIEWGVPVRKYEEESRNPKTGLYETLESNEGEIIFDRSLSKKDTDFGGFLGRYWETWLNEQRGHPLLVRVVEELGEKANTDFSNLEIVEIPDGMEYEIDEYDGSETIREKHRSW